MLSRLQPVASPDVQNDEQDTVHLRTWGALNVLLLKQSSTHRSITVLLPEHKGTNAGLVVDGVETGTAAAAAVAAGEKEVVALLPQEQEPFADSASEVPRPFSSLIQIFIFPQD